MLSYRHGFHAGNHADVLKHCVLAALLRHLTEKDKALLFVDTHAGAGSYSLVEGFAARNAEFETGIARLWTRTDLPALLADYVAVVREFNPDGTLRRYPGSPQVACRLLRPKDRLRLFELHSTESRLLAEEFRDEGRRVSVVAGDGFAGLKAVLPPPSRRGLVLIDPSYEVASDYRDVAAALREARERFATGCYAIWYPRLARRESTMLPDKLLRLAGADWLHATLTVRGTTPEGFGLLGSGMIVVNPPWKLHAELRQTMPVLARLLAQDAGAGFTLAHRQT